MSTPARSGCQVGVGCSRGWTGALKGHAFFAYAAAKYAAGLGEKTAVPVAERTLHQASGCRDPRGAGRGQLDG